MSILYPWFLSLLLLLLIYILGRTHKQSIGQNIRWVALGFLIIALSRPVIKESTKEQTIPAHSVILALDISASMRADDIKPNRAKASREIIKRFLEENKKDQIALIGFTINPLLLSPPTTDHNLLSISLDTLRDEYILTKGTNIKKLLQKVAKFPDTNKLLVLFSDGGDDIIDEDLVLFADDNHIEVLVVAMATQRGSSIKTKNNNLIKDKKGHIVISKFNSSLSKLGKVIEFSSPEEVSSSIESWVEEQSISKNGLKRHSNSYFELFFIPLIFALILIFLSGTRFILKVIPLLALLGIHAEAYDIWDSYYLNQAYLEYQDRDYNSTLKELLKIEDRSLETEIIRANSYYKLGKYKKAKAVWKSIKTTNPRVKKQLFYNLGNCEAQLSYYDKAKDYYIKSLIFGEDNDTLFNLKVVIFLKQRYKSKVGFTNPNSSKSSNSSDNNTQAKDKPTAKKEQKAGSSGGNGSQKSKLSTVKIVKSTAKTSSNKEMSSKAYDLINEGYIKEDKPW